MARRHKPRRGIVLLIILTLLTLLIVVGLTFAILSGPVPPRGRSECAQGTLWRSAGQSGRSGHVSTVARHQ